MIVNFDPGMAAARAFACRSIEEHPTVPKRVTDAKMNNVAIDFRVISVSNAVCFSVDILFMDAF
jgi:hypothetical protein